MTVSQEFHTQGIAHDVDPHELIQVSGAIQPHGALLAVLVDSGLVTHASANLFAILGRRAEAVLGKPLESAIGEVASRALQDAESSNGFELYRLHALPGPGGDALHLRSFRSDRHLCIDIEPVDAKFTQGQHASVRQSIMETFEHAADSIKLCEIAVRGLKTIAGYDRVMAYRFGEDGHGKVIAEAREPHLDSVMGLRYPAADISPQARQQYLRQRVTGIADSSHWPVLLLEASDDHTLLDLTDSSLRSVSPVDLECMHNMHIAASLTIGLTHRQNLWGMLICHHESPRVAGPELRAVAGTIGQVVSLLLGSLEEAELLAARIERMTILRALTERLAADGSLMDAFAAAEPELLGLVGATGAVLRLSGKVLRFGRAPSPSEAERALAVLHSEAGGDLLAVDDLSLRYPDLASCAGEASGALLLPFVGGADDAILWFRPELAQTIAWIGNTPEHAISDSVVATESISPRSSFGTCKEIVTGHSAPWVEADLALARDLWSAIKAEVAKRAKAELLELRRYDPLTRLPNRALLQERLAEARKEAGTALTLLFLSLDETKKINETMGYAAGDELLIEVARRLVATAGPGNLAARLGGAEFVVLCRGLQLGEAAELGEDIRRAVAAPFEIGGRLFHVASGVGIAAVDQSDMLDPEGAADFAMHEAITMVGAKHRAESQRQKMETLGRTMGGVAHEINNMLQPIALLAQDVIDKELVVGEGRQHLDVVLDCSKKARQIIGDMLAFSRPPVSTMETHDPVALLHDSLPIVRQAVPPSLVLSIQTEGHLPPVKMNRTAFVQILLNLAINAAAATGGQGELTITLEEDVRGFADAEMRQQTSFVRLRVADNGCGMDKATLDRAFEPFFTTKPVGQGTGLGLPVVYGLVREMGATIVLASEPDHGTTVTILIPANSGEAQNGVDTGH